MKRPSARAARAVAMAGAVAVAGSVHGATVAPVPVPVDAPAAGFVVRYDPPETPHYAPFREHLGAHGFLEGVAAELNRTLVLPRDVVLRLAECGHSTTSWSAAERAVTVCYEFLEAVIVIAGEPGERPEARDGSAAVTAEATPERAERLFAGAVTFALLAEVGRALVGIYDLPVDGAPAAAGDEFAAVSLAAADRDGDGAASGALEFWALALATPDSGFEWLEAHDFDAARLRRVACLLYGHAPRRHDAAVRLGLVAPADASRCAGELARVAAEWDRRLADHVRPRR